MRSPLLAGLVVVMLAFGCGQKVTPVFETVSRGEWSAAPVAPRARALGQSVAAGGRLYLVGGQIGGRGVDWVDVYDPSLRAWTSGPPLPPDAPTFGVAIAASDDKVYLLGGFNDGFVPNHATYVLDAAEWKRLGDQPVSRGAATAQAIDGKIYVAGGGNDETHARLDVYAYDVAANAWSQRTNMPTERQSAASCVLGGKFVVIGGRLSAGNAALTVTQAFDPATNVWGLEDDMPTPRSELGATTIGDTCFAIGGEQPNGPPGALGAVEGFSFARGWFTYTDMPTPRDALGVASLGGLVYAAGGETSRGGAPSGVLEVFTVPP